MRQRTTVNRRTSGITKGTEMKSLFKPIAITLFLDELALFAIVAAMRWIHKRKPQTT